MSYCIAFSAEGATDVTRRYVRNAALHGNERNKCPEAVLVWILQEIKRMRREGITLKEDRKKLLIEDEREDRELKNFVIRSLAASIGNMIPTNGMGGLGGMGGSDGRGGGFGGNGRAGGAGGGAGATSPGEAAKLEERQSGEREWREARGEARQTSGNHEPGYLPQGGLPPPDQ